MVPRGLEPRTFRLLAERSNQLSYETDDILFRPTTKQRKSVLQAKSMTCTTAAVPRTQRKFDHQIHGVDMCVDVELTETRRTLLGFTCTFWSLSFQAKTNARPDLNLLLQRRPLVFARALLLTVKKPTVKNRCQARWQHSLPHNLLQSCAHNAPIFRLLLKVAVSVTHQCN